MAKKTSSAPPAQDEGHRSVQDAAQQIWLAGLGAFAKAQQEGGKVFETLVADGLTLQRQTQAAAQAQMAEASEKLSSMAGGLSSRAGQQLDRLEGIFEERVAKALQRLNMATLADVQALEERIDALQAQVRQLSRPAAKSSNKPAAKRSKSAS